MASLTKVYDKQKLLGQVYTPSFVVEKILTDIGFDKPNIIGKTILDPSCGDGRFLVAVARRIIQYSNKENLQENLEKIYGWDIDPKAITACIDNLNQLLENLDITVNWHIELGNSLEYIEHNTKKYDFIVGNPPYIRIQHLAEKDRKFIQTYYQFCKSGSTDIYIAFYELCDKLLAEQGICGLITPNTFLYSETAKQMRAYFAKQQSILQITNYGDIQLFDHATTYSAIAIFGKQQRDFLVFEQAKTAQTFENKTIDFTTLKNEKIWQLSVAHSIETEGVKLKDICKIHVGITTLCDKAYIFKVQTIANEPDFVLAETKLKGWVKIEKEILKPIVKASKLKNDTSDITEYILFPYQKTNGKHSIIPEQTLQNNYPLAYHYLRSIKNELDKRDNGKPNTVAWYAFGRSQGLETSFGKKILFSPMNNKPNFILHEYEAATFYSGYCIKYQGDYHFLLAQLNSEKLANFIAISSRDFRGGWKAYNKSVLQEFRINLN